METEVKCCECINCCNWSLRRDYNILKLSSYKDKIYMIQCKHCNLIRVYKRNDFGEQCRFLKFLNKTDAEYIIWKLK